MKGVPGVMVLLSNTALRSFLGTLMPCSGAGDGMRMGEWGGGGLNRRSLVGAASGIGFVLIESTLLCPAPAPPLPRPPTPRPASAPLDVWKAAVPVHSCLLTQMPSRCVAGP